MSICCISAGFQAPVPHPFCENIADIALTSMPPPPPLAPPIIMGLLNMAAICDMSTMGLLVAAAPVVLEPAPPALPPTDTALVLVAALLWFVLFGRVGSCAPLFVARLTSTCGGEGVE